MESMQRPGRVATWLELAVAPDWRRQHCRVRVHRLDGEAGGGCYALSMDDRWLCTGDGRLTVFNGLEAALRFLKLVRVEDFESEDTPVSSVACNGNYYCLCVGRGGALSACPAGCRLQRFDA